MIEFEHKVYLKQHTPILHFQGEYAESGATLRATELKPKLDRYISANHTIKPGWRIGSTDALNYKIKISNGEGYTAKCESLPMYFAEPKKKPTDENFSKKPIFARTKESEDSMSESYSVCLHIFCLNEELYNLLKGINYSEFFIATTFGTRQSKGYGSFFPVKSNAPVFEPKTWLGKTITIDRSKLNNNEYENVDYRVDSFFSLAGYANDWNNVMVHINDVYKCLRGGINEGGLYFKSLMFSYAKYAKTSNKPEGLFWDKRMIKELFYPKIIKDQYYGNKDKDEAQKRWTIHRMGKPIPLKSHPDSDALKPDTINQDPFLFRDYLGLSTVETWKIPYNKTITKKSNQVSRFKSPILFKPLFIDNKWFVFLLHRDIPKGFMNDNLIFRVSDANIKYKGNLDTEAPYYSEYGDQRLYKMMKPYPNFSMTDYMNFVWGVHDYGRCFSISGNIADAQKRKDRIVKDLNCIRDNYLPIKQ